MFLILIIVWKLLKNKTEEIDIAMCFMTSSEIVFAHSRLHRSDSVQLQPV